MLSFAGAQDNIVMIIIVKFLTDYYYPLKLDYYIIIFVSALSR